MRVIVTGASRGLGAAVASIFARRYKETAAIALLGRSLSNPAHEGLEGTLLETAAAVQAHGATALPIQVDARCGEECKSAIEMAARAMGGVDVLVNNASALYLGETLPVKQMDLLYYVNTRGTLLCMDACKPYLEESSGSIVTLSPPIRMSRLDWIAPAPAYTISKYSMTLATFGHASETVRANCLWPRYTVATAATRRLEAMGFEGAFSKGRDPDEVAEAVLELAVRPTTNARAWFDDEVLPLPPTDAPLDVFAVEA